MNQDRHRRCVPGEELSHQAVLARMRAGQDDHEIAEALGLEPSDIQKIRLGLRSPVVVVD